MSRPRDHLAAELAKKVSRYGVVVWDDRDKRYGVDIAAQVTPDGAGFTAYDGSWFALRREIEPLLSQPTRPALVVYVPARRPDPRIDPLEEVRQSGTSWAITLDHLLRQSLDGELTPARIDSLSSQARTLVEAERDLEGDTAIDARLVTLFDTADVVAIAADALSGRQDADVTADDAWAHVAEALGTHLGTDLPEKPDALRSALFQHVALVVLRAALGSLPDVLASAARPVTPAQAARCAAVLERLGDPRRLGTYRDLASSFDADLRIPSVLTWVDGLTDVDISPGIEEAAVTEAFRRLGNGDFEGAHRLADQRLRTSRWAQSQRSQPGEPLSPDHPHRRWNAVHRIASLRREIDQRPPPKATAPALLAWYASEGWKVDRAHRLGELSRADLGHLGGLDQHVASARQAYERWLDDVATASTAAVARDGLDPDGLVRQSETFARCVDASAVPTAYVLVDALRLELGHALTERLGRRWDGDQAAGGEAAVAAAPTITPVGMANVLPGAEDGLTIQLDGTSLVTSVEGKRLRSVADRVALLRHAAGSVLDLDLTALMARTDDRLTNELADADLIVVRSTDIDAAGESGRAGTAWRAVDGVIDDLATQILRLGRLGIRRVVVTADHGFIALSEQLSTGRVLARPDGEGELHRRCWVGRGGVTPDGALRLPLADLGVSGGLDLVVPAGLSVFPSAGSRQFFHGGLSPQELIVPVIALDLEPTSSDTGVPAVAISVAGKGITTGVFAATLTFSGSLFANEVSVRIVARTSKGATTVARLVAGDGYDADAGTVSLSVEPSVLTFQVVENLDRSTPVELQVLDATTGLELATSKVPVATRVVVEEDWL